MNISLQQLESPYKPYATLEDLHLAESLFQHPDFRTMDEHGNPTCSRSQEFSNSLQLFIDSLNWEPMIIEENGKLGLWNQFSQKMILPVIYDSFTELPQQNPLNDITNSGIIAKLNGKWGVTSSDGKNKTIVPFIFDNISRYDNGWFIAVHHKKMGLFTSDGEVLLSCSADRIWYDPDLGIDLYQQQSRFGLITPKTDAIFNSIRRAHNNTGDTDYIIGTQNGMDFCISAEDGQCIPFEHFDDYHIRMLRVFNM